MEAAPHVAPNQGAAGEAIKPPRKEFNMSLDQVINERGNKRKKSDTVPDHIKNAAIKRFRRGGSNKKWRKRPHQSGAEEGELPNLGDLAKANRSRANMYFHRHGGNLVDAPPSTCPRTVPRAPENNNTYLMRHNPLGPQRQHPFTTPSGATPIDPWTSGYESLEEDLAEFPSFDMFGSNQGLIRKTSHHVAGTSDAEESDSSGSDTDEVNGFKLIKGYGDSGDEDPDDVSKRRSRERRLRMQLTEQSAYIDTLEEENLKLKERLYLMEKELADARGLSSTLVHHQSKPQAWESDSDCEPAEAW